MATTKYYVCGECSKRFKAGRINYKNMKSNRYICPSCKAKIDGDNRYLKTGMRQSYLAMILKIVIGLSFITSSSADADAGPALTVFLAVIGVILLVSAIYPFLMRKKRKRDMYR